MHVEDRSRSWLKANLAPTSASSMPSPSCDSALMFILTCAPTRKRIACDLNGSGERHGVGHGVGHGIGHGTRHGVRHGVRHGCKAGDTTADTTADTPSHVGRLRSDSRVHDLISHSLARACASWCSQDIVRPGVSPGGSNGSVSRQLANSAALPRRCVAVAPRRRGSAALPATSRVRSVQEPGSASPCMRSSLRFEGTAPVSRMTAFLPALATIRSARRRSRSDALP